MKQAGFELIKTSFQRGYRVVELKSEEIYHNQRATARYTADISAGADADKCESSCR